MPTRTPAATAMVSEDMRASSATASAMTSSWTPLPWARPSTGVERSGAASTAVSPVSPPASSQTSVETRRVLSPARRVASSFDAIAVIAIPHRDRLRNHARPSARTGVTTSATSCAPWMVMPPTCQLPDNAAGNGRLSPSTDGTLMTITMTTWAAPMVATKSVTRDALASRRTTVISIAADVSADAATPTATAGTNGQFQSRAIFATSTAASEPIAP